MALAPVSIDVDAPPEAVFDFLTEPAKLGAWAGDMLMVWSDEPLRSGMKFDAKPIVRLMGVLFGWLTQRTMARRLWLLKRAVEDSHDVT